MAGVLLRREYESLIHTSDAHLRTLEGELRITYLLLQNLARQEYQSGRMLSTSLLLSLRDSVGVRYFESSGSETLL